MSKSMSRRIARHGTSKPMKRRALELTPQAVAIATGLDLYHARIALHGTTISPAQIKDKDLKKLAV